MRLTRAEWRALLYWFVRGATSAVIAAETGLERKRILRALTIVREAMLLSNPIADPERDGPSWDSSAALRRPRQALIGLFSTHGLIGAEVIIDDEAGHVVKLLSSRREHGPHAALHGYAAVVHRGRLHRLHEQGASRAPFGQIEAFWSYLQRHLRAKGGIRPARLNLYLAEFGWRYNHRKISPAEQSHELLRLLGDLHRWPARDYPLLRKHHIHPGFSPVGAS